MPAPLADPLPSPVRRNLLWWTLQKLLQVLCAVLFRYQASGIENVPREGPALLLINHQSYLDPILVGLPLDRPVSMVARKNLYQIPLFGRLLKGLYGLEIDRDSPGTAVIREIVRRLDHGFLIAIFPEGTRSSGTQLGPIKPGFVSILRRANVPIIPVGIAGADRALPRGASFPRPTKIRVTFGEPIPESDVAPLKARGKEDELLKLVSRKIQTQVDQSAALKSACADHEVLIQRGSRCSS